MDSVSGVGVIDKGVLIVRNLARAPLDLAGLQQATDLPRATAHRLAVALEQHGLLLMVFELVMLAILTFAAIGTDDYWTRRRDSKREP